MGNMIVGAIIMLLGVIFGAVITTTAKNKED